MEIVRIALLAVLTLEAVAAFLLCLRGPLDKS
jgi:hypothetical protein